MGLKTDIISTNKEVIDCSIEYEPVVDYVPGKNNKYLKGIDRGRSFHAAILYIDMKGSTKLVSNYANKNIAKIHKSYFNTIINCIEYFGGNVRSLNGDSVLAFFVDGVENINKYDCAIDAALNINNLLNYDKNCLNNLIDKFDAKLNYGIGITQGNIKCVAIGDESYSRYLDKMWISYEVNFATKIVEKCNLPYCIGISEDVYNNSSQKIFLSSRKISVEQRCVYTTNKTKDSIES